MALKIVDHPSVADFLSAVTTLADDVRLNLILGGAVESWLLQHCPEGTFDVPPLSDSTESKADAEARVLVTVWQGDDLRLVFVKIGSSQARLASPSEPRLVPLSAVPLLPSLVTHLLDLPTFSSTPHLLRTLAGPQSLVLPFLDLWPHAYEPKPGLEIHACSTRTPPPPASSALPEGHSIVRLDCHASSRQDLEAVANLFVEFTSYAGRRTSLEDALANVRRSAHNAALWVYRAPRRAQAPAAEAATRNASAGAVASAAADQGESVGFPVAFCMTGRPTPRTVAIRAVMVSPLARGRGVGERLVSFVTRLHLVEARPVGLYDFSSQVPLDPDDLFDPVSKFGKKDEVCLFVEVKEAVPRRLYKRVGFTESEDKWGDYSLVGVEKGSW
ncbi:hypothetical protein JCM10212_004045 [Sporobolomyces blumeae]